MTNKRIRQDSSIQYINDFIVLKNCTLDSVKEMFGECSKTYKAVKTIKAQDYNFLKLDYGRSIIMNTAETDVTRASFITPEWTETKLMALKRLSDG